MGSEGEWGGKWPNWLEFSPRALLLLKATRSYFLLVRVRLTVN